MRRAQDAAAEALQSAERASKAKTDFLSNMSHDIRTPMNAIIGITTLMKNELHEPEKLAEHLGKLETSGQLLLGIINNILDMSRIESGKTTLNVEKMNLPQQISQLDNIIRQQAGQRCQSFTVNTNLQHENVLGDPNRLNQVLMNILSNAVKYTPTGGHIRFEVEELPQELHAGQGRSSLFYLRERLRLLHRVRFGINGEFQHYLKAGALAGGALHADGAAHQVYDAFGNSHT